MKSLHVQTPLWESRPLQAVMGVPVFLKMDALQPVGSFKIRGIGFACQQRVAEGATHLVCSSGGNAGYAVAYAGRELGVRVTIVVPETASEQAREKIRGEGATLLVHGEVWDISHAHALELASEAGSAYVHPFDDPVVWQGHASMIEEVAESGVKPGAVVVSVGGGGLLCGVLEGMHRVGWTDVPVVAVETEGAASFAASVEAGRLVTLDRIRSIATTLGARTVTAEALAWCGRHPIRPWTVSDREAVDACMRFVDDHRVLVEPACGAALAAVYGQAEPLLDQASVLVIVCGGAGVSLELLQEWDAKV
ncbi:MAG: pyridoxal-phosphate dependent enzyme [bacterium]|nr:pyridoxal-phosphate dependent enzyme [bacterium]